MTSSSSVRVGVAGVVLLLGLQACQLFQARGTAAEPITDRDIASVFLAANNTDVSYAQVALAPGRTNNASIIAFANRMLNDHGGLNRSALEVFSSMNLVPRENQMSLDFRDESAARRDTLRELTGRPFDIAYIDNEVRYHSRLLVTLDSLLIPAARHADMKALLARVRPAVAAHLEHASRLQAELGR